MPSVLRLAYAAALASLVSATSPKQSAPGSGIQSFLINYNFETFPQTKTGQAAVAISVPVNDYDLLHFNTLLVNETQPPVAGVACHTPPVCSAFALNTDILDSILTPGANPVSLGPAYITAAYQYSPISYFDPYAFYYGCLIASANGAASLPVDCNITATGYNSAGKAIYSQVFSYTATGAVLQQMTLGYFNQGWSGLQVQTLDLSVTNNATTAALFDNFIASVYGPQNAAILVDF